MYKHLARRTGALLAVTALGAAGLVAAPGVAAAAPAPGADPAPSGAAAAWLAGQLEDGLLTYTAGDFESTDYGLSIDTALALADVGGQDAAVTAVRDAVAAGLGGYISGEAFGDAGSTYAGSAAKALVLATATGGDPESFGGTDLVARVESVTDDTTGRIADISAYGDYANTLGQSFAARGLAAADSQEAAAATELLLEQQCEAGFFRQALPAVDATGAVLTCDGATGAEPSVDATATAVLNLLPQGDDQEVAAAIERAAAWLVSVQAADGAFGADDQIETPNANSTGLAGWALGLVGEAGPAAKAAAWLRSHELTNVGSCTPFRAADLGAVAYDDAALAAARKDGVTTGTEGQFLRATAQALPALQWAPAGSGDASVLAAPDYVKAGSVVRPGVIGAAPGEWLCASLGGRSASVPADAAGEAVLAVRLPKGAGTRTVTVRDADGVVGTARYRALGATKLRVQTTKAKVRRGAKQVVKVRGLAAGEPVRIIVGGRRVADGQAGAQGRYTGRFKATGSGRTVVVVKGQFGNRTGRAAYRVVR